MAKQNGQRSSPHGRSRRPPTPSPSHKAVPVKDTVRRDAGGRTNNYGRSNGQPQFYTPPQKIGKMPVPVNAGAESFPGQRFFYTPPGKITEAKEAGSANFAEVSATGMPQTRRGMGYGSSGASGGQRQAGRNPFMPPVRISGTGTGTGQSGEAISETARRIDQANRYYADRDWFETHVLHPADQILQTPARYIEKTVENGDDDSMDGYRYAKNKIGIAGDILGDITDRSRANELRDKENRLDHYAAAGDKIDQIAGRTITDAEQLTLGDIKAFEAAERNPRLTVEKLREIRDQVNARAADAGKLNYKVMAHTNQMRKRAERVARASRMNAAEQYAENLIQAHLHLFTLREQQILAEENSVFRVESLSDFQARDILLNKILSQQTFWGETAKLDWSKLRPRDLKRILEGRGPVKPINSIQRGLIEMKFQVHENYQAAKLIKKRRAGRKGVAQTIVSGTMVDPVMKDRELQSSLDIVSKTASTAKYAVRVVSASANAAGILGTGMAKAGLNSTAALLDAAGKADAAQTVRAGAQGVQKAYDAVNDAKEKVAGAPRKTGEKITNAAALETSKFVAWLKQTRPAQYLANTRAAKGFQYVKKGASKAAEGIGKAGHAVMAPFRAAGRGADAVKSVAVKFALAIGALLAVESVIVLLTSGSGGGGGAVVTTILDSDENFQDFQRRYDENETAFQNQIEGIVNGTSQTLNKKGQPVHYGVLGAANESGSENDDFRNGVTMDYDGSVSNNLEDILSAMTVVMQQTQNQYHAEAMELLDAMYKSTHTYSYEESPLYPCESGCEISSYFCNEAKIMYPSTDLRFSPWLFEDLYVPDADHECEVCREVDGMTFDQYAGCTPVSVCYHNEGTDDDNFGRHKPSRSQCSNPVPYWDCDHECDDPDCSHDCSGTTLGCAGYWYCGGHDHYGCPNGHQVPACYGHVNITMHVNIAALEQIFEMGGVPVVEE